MISMFSKVDINIPIIFLLIEATILLFHNLKYGVLEYMHCIIITTCSFVSLFRDF
jgi:hypothetical protein